MYKLPTVRQIVLHWPVKPTAKVVALIIRDFADEKMGNEVSQKQYDLHMSQQERDEYNSDRFRDAKVWISVRKLAAIAHASPEGVDTALDELQSKKLVDSDRPKGKPKRKGNKGSYFYRLHNAL